MHFHLETAPIDTGAGIASRIPRATGVQFTAIDSNQEDWFYFRTMFFCHVGLARILCVLAGSTSPHSAARAVPLSTVDSCKRLASCDKKAFLKKTE